MPYAPRATLDNPYGPQITFRTEDVLPPTAYYISPEDQVTVWLITDVLALTVFIQLRMLMPTGEIKLIPYQFTPQSTYTWYAAYEVPPWEGYLLGAMCWSSNPQRGQCFVSAQVMRSTPPNLLRAGIVLLQGYISTINILSYPTSPLEAPFSGRGAWLNNTQTTVTGVQLYYQSPPNTLWKLYSLQFTLNTSAAAGNRIVTIIQDDVSGIQTGVWPYPYTQAPSSTVLYTFAPGCSSSQQGQYVTIGAPTEVFIPAQSSLRTFVVGLDAADTFTAIAARFEEWMGI